MTLERAKKLGRTPKHFSGMEMDWDREEKKVKVVCGVLRGPKKDLGARGKEGAPLMEVKKGG